MGRRRRDRPAGVEPHEAARIERALLRVEERLMVAPPGLHLAAPPAPAAECADAGIPPAAAMVWTRFDGLEIGTEMARLLPRAEISSATATAQAEGLLRSGDLVVGEWGRDLLVLPADPYEEGADVVRVEEGGERLPEASTVAHLVLGMLGEASVMFDDDGEFRDELFGDDGQLRPAVQRRILRRRLDLDPDAPRPRLRLAQHLLAAGELRAAASEIQQVLRRAPELPWAYETLGRVHQAEGALESAHEAYVEAAQRMDAVDPSLAAYFRARAAGCVEGAERERLVQQVREARPDFAREQVDAAQVLIEREEWAQAREVVTLGLVVSPGQVELLALRGELAARSQQDDG